VERWNASDPVILSDAKDLLLVAGLKQLAAE
jgi:hypothetical protein